MNIAEGRTVIVEMVKRLYSFLQVLGGLGVFREQRLWTAAPGQPAQPTAGSLATRPVLGLGLQAPAPERQPPFSHRLCELEEPTPGHLSDVSLGRVCVWAGRACSSPFVS